MGSLLTFDSGGPTTVIQENWGLNLSGQSIRPVKIYNSSLLVGYQSTGADYGINNALINGKVGIGTISPAADYQFIGWQFMLASPFSPMPTSPAEKLQGLGSGLYMFIFTLPKTLMHLGSGATAIKN